MFWLNKQKGPTRTISSNRILNYDNQKICLVPPKRHSCWAFLLVQSQHFSQYNDMFISGWKLTNQNFLIKFITFLVEIIGILIDTIFLVKSTKILIFIRIIIPIRILVISIRILVDLTRKFWFVRFPPELQFNPIRSFFSVQFLAFLFLF